VIAVASRWYSYLAGTGVYVPGYGFATVEDIGGGFPDRYWIDLGYSDDDFITWGDWVTLYFLTPVPVNIQYVLPYR
jgi:3D (Asp-Asp-Asp) domain-containing protein